MVLIMTVISLSWLPWLAIYSSKDVKSLQMNKKFGSLLISQDVTVLLPVLDFRILEGEAYKLKSRS